MEKWVSCAQAMVKCLEEEKVQVVFGYPGAAICPFYDELSHSSIRHILVRHEQCAGHAASGYARIKGEVGVCIATSGPGALNLITAIATAYMDSIPMVVLTGQVSSELLGRDVFQEADITGSAEPFVKHSYLVKNAQELPLVFKKAFYLASTGRPGPVLIDVPVDVQQTKIKYAYPESVEMRSYKPSIQGHPMQIKRVVEALAKSERPLICAGGGVFPSGAQEELVKLAESLRIPVVTTMMGIGAIPSAHPLYMGMIGTHGVKSANTAMHESDLLILIGARVGDRAVVSPSLLSKRTKIVHIDIDPAEIGKNVTTHIPLVGDAKIILSQLLEQLPPVADYTSWTQRLAALRPGRQDAVSGAIDPKAFMRELSAQCDDDAVVVADVGQNQIWTANHFAIRKGRFLTSGGMGTMGYSIPAAVGAKLADPSRQVIAVCGDGSFQMQMMELATMCQHDVPVKIVVMRNGALGMVRELQKKSYGDNLVAVSLDGSPDFVRLAQAYGIPARRVERMEDTGEAIAALLAADTPYLLECVVPADEPTL